jgi:integrase
MAKAKGIGHQRERLKAITVERLAKKGKPAKVCDGGGLWLYVRGPTAASWVYRYRMAGVDREAGLGKYPDLGLADAREMAAEMRRAKAMRLDPIEDRRRQSGMTFAAAAESYIASQAPGWRNAKTEHKWRAILRDHASPLGSLAVAAINVPAVLRALAPVWTAQPNTGRDLRGYIERVLDWSIAHGYRDGDNPATLKLLRNLLPAQPTSREHHAALLFSEMPAFLRALRGKKTLAARALEFVILTAARTGEVLGADWSEIDLAAKVWTIPPSRMKEEREHKVPLSDRAIAILEGLGPQSCGRVFPISPMTMAMMLRRMDRTATVHGFRSTFRDWSSDVAHIERDIAEAALAHAVGGKAERAYRRGDFFERRRQVMQSWADACSGEPAASNIITLRA